MRIQFVFVPFVVLALTACGGISGKADYPKDDYDKQRAKYGSVLDIGKEDGDTGNVLWSSGKKDSGGGMSVNAYLWRAALDTISFMPLASADSNGGVIITDWYTPAESPNERVKLNVRIKDKTLRADGVKVSVFRQEKRGSDWIDTAPNAATGAQLEEAILTRAREIKAEGANGERKKAE